MERPSLDFTEKELKIAYFLVSKKQLLKKILIIFLIFLNITIYFYTIYHFSLYLIQSKDYEKMEKDLTSQIIDYNTIHQVFSPLPPVIISTKAIFLGDSKYHLICLVRNPNRNWFIKSLNYKFVFPNFETVNFTSFILPEEEKILVDFNENIKTRTGEIYCEINNVVWQRIKPDKYYLLEIPRNFTVKDLKFLPAKRPDERSITLFKFVNPTIYNFWEIDLLTILYQGSEIAGIDKTVLKEVKSREEKEIKIIWPQAVPFYSEIKIQPEINIFDSSLFIPPSS